MDTETTSTRNKQSMAIPAAILIGFAMIAVAIFFSNGNMFDQNKVANNQIDTEPETSLSNINEITEDDHVRGNPNAPIIIVEYSDFDCPFCKNFHETMNKVMDNYGPTGQVAWVYRNMPLEGLHPGAPQVAAAAECVAKQAGNDGFWKFADLVFGEREVNEQTNLSRLTEFATTAGADKAAFEACLNSGETKADVDEDFANAISVGAQGTPYSIVMVGDQMGVINGAQQYPTVKQIIDNLISQMSGEGQAE